MKRILFVSFFLYAFCARAQRDEIRLDSALKTLDGVSVLRKTAATASSPLVYFLAVRQPLDHNDPRKGFFNQQVILRHKAFTQPVVMETEGYEGSAYGNEVEQLFAANNLNVEHRYFGTSKPDSLQWPYLTVEQTTADLHRINQLFRNLYPASKWISTGISRGGQVSIYYKYHYPNDIDVVVPYVAPLPLELEDKRVYTFLDTVSTRECRAKLFEVQKFLLQHETEAVEKLKWYVKGSKQTFTYFRSLNEVFEYWVLEYPFAFWQIGALPCDSIPTNKSVDTYLTHVLEHVGSIDFFSDKYIQEWAAHNYMAVTQTGYYGYNLAPLRPYLKHLKGRNPSAAFPPKSVRHKPFDSSFTRNVHAWLAEKGNNFLYVYGSRDTWSACRVIVSNRVNSRSFMVPGANHFDARVKNMPASMQAEFVRELEKMTGLKAIAGGSNQ